MSWFRKKGKYWYFVTKEDNKEIQHYIGDDEAVKKKLWKSDFDTVHKAINDLWRTLFPNYIQ